MGVLSIGLVGKYVKLHDAYRSVAEALRHAGYETPRLPKLPGRMTPSQAARHPDTFSGVTDSRSRGWFQPRDTAESTMSHISAYLWVCRLR